MAQGRRSASISAKGEYLFHLDADMKLAPRVLRAMFKENRRLTMLSLSLKFPTDRAFWAKVKIFERSMYVGDDTIESARFFKTFVYRSVGGHNEKMVLSEDKGLRFKGKEVRLQCWSNK